MADPAQLTTISWNGTAIPEIESFTGPALGHEVIEVTDLDNTAAQYIAGEVFDAGEVTLNLHFDPDNAVHDAIADDCIAGNSRTVVVTFQNGTAATNTYSLTAFATNVTPAGSTKGALTGSVTLKGTGAITIA